MSLKAIKEALDLLETHIKDNGPCDHAVNICSCGERQALADAREQVATMEKAAVSLHTSMYGRGWASNGVHEAFALVETIAKEAE